MAPTRMFSIWKYNDKHWAIHISLNEEDKNYLVFDYADYPQQTKTKSLYVKWRDNLKTI